MIVISFLCLLSSEGFDSSLESHSQPASLPSQEQSAFTSSKTGDNCGKTVILGRGYSSSSCNKVRVEFILLNSFSFASCLFRFCEAIFEFSSTSESKLEINEPELDCACPDAINTCLVILAPLFLSLTDCIVKFSMLLLFEFFVGDNSNDNDYNYTNTCSN